MVMSLLVRPNRVVLPILIPGGIPLTRLTVGVGVYVTQVVVGTHRCTLHMDIYADVLVARITVYPMLMVVHLSV